MTRALPGTQFFRLARVFVKHDGVQSPDHFVDLADQFVNEFGVGDLASKEFAFREGRTLEPGARTLGIA